jgi:hypothetical protein
MVLERFLGIPYLKASPIIVSGSLTAIASTQTLPCLSCYLASKLIHSYPFASCLNVLVARHCQDIGLPSRFQPRSQRWVASIDGITCHPGHREARIQGSHQHACG